MNLYDSEWNLESFSIDVNFYGFKCIFQNFWKISIIEICWVRSMIASMDAFFYWSTIFMDKWLAKNDLRELNRHRTLRFKFFKAHFFSLTLPPSQILWFLGGLLQAGKTLLQTILTHNSNMTEVQLKYKWIIWSAEVLLRGNTFSKTTFSRPQNTKISTTTCRVCSCFSFPCKVYRYVLTILEFNVPEWETLKLSLHNS